MQLSLSPVLLAVVALGCALPVARAQDALPPEAPAPQLAPLPKLAPSPKPAVPLRAIKVRNVPAAILAYQLDPAHNAPPPGYGLVPLKRDVQTTTPLLDRLAGARATNLLAQWIQIDDATLDRELPGWTSLSVRDQARVLTPLERQALDKLNAAKQISPLTQRIVAFDAQPAFLSYLPFRAVIERTDAPQSRPAPPAEIDPGILPQPRPDSLFAAPPYIPNIAENNSTLEQMAPMPNMNPPIPPVAPVAPDPFGAFVPGLNPYLRAAPNDPSNTNQPIPPVAPNAVPGANPYYRVVPGGLADMQGLRFQITPTFNTDQSLILQLRAVTRDSTLAAPLPSAYVAGVKLVEGESAVFSVPQSLTVVAGSARRTFLVVTPTFAPQSVPALPPIALPKIPGSPAP